MELENRKRIIIQDQLNSHQLGFSAGTSSEAYKNLIRKFKEILKLQS